MQLSHPHSSGEHYRRFLKDSQGRRLDDALEPGPAARAAEPRPLRGEKRREYLRDCLRWLWPHRYATAAVFAFALLAAGLQMIEPLFMRFIIDRVLFEH